MSAASTDEAMSSYRLPDEPKPGRLERLVTDPIWPLFATMLAGAWLGLPWFAFNAFALGSPTRWRELQPGPWRAPSAPAACWSLR